MREKIFLDLPRSDLYVFTSKNTTSRLAGSNTMKKRRDSQVVELLGRNWLVSELLSAGLEVAIPMRDRGIDLIAFADLRPKVKSFAACPIQMKAAWESSFSVQRKYSRIRNLVVTYVWYVGDPARTRTYALTYSEAVNILRKMGFAKTLSWRKVGYSVSHPSRKLVTLLEPFRMSPEKWWKKIVYV